MLYPFSEKAVAFLKETIKQKDSIEIVSVVAPKGWSVSDELKKGNNANQLRYDVEGVHICNDFYMEVKKCDCVIFLSCLKVELMYSDIKSKIITSIEKGKNIWCIFPLKEEDKVYLKEYAEKHNVIYEQYEENNCWERTYYDRERKLYKPEAIVIGVGKIINKIDVTYSIYNMVNKYKRDGYRVAVVSDNENFCFFKETFFKYPQKFLSNELNNNERIIYFNRFLKYIEHCFHPEVIVIEFPEQMMKFSDDCIGDFGVLSYSIAQAVEIDYFVLEIDINSYDLQLVNNYYKYRFGFEIDAVIITNVVVDVSCSLEDKEIVVYYVDKKIVQEFIEEYKKEFEYQMISSCIEAEYENLVQQCIKQLSY